MTVTADLHISGHEQILPGAGLGRQLEDREEKPQRSCSDVKDCPVVWDRYSVIWSALL